MIYPEQDEIEYSTPKYITCFPFNVNSLKTRSPTLPLHFDKQYLPTDLCEKQLINLSECLLLYNIRQKQLNKMCALQASKFQSCRRGRDLRIISAIYKWQTQHVKKLDRQNRGLYLRGLGFKLDRLQGDLSRQPSTMKGLSKIEELQFEVKELKWRLGYLKQVRTDLGE